MPILSSLRNIARVLIPVVLLLVVGFITNSTINQHFHELSSGIIEKHAHPYEKGAGDDPFSDHNHTTLELILLNQLFNTFSEIVIFLIISVLVFKILVKIIFLTDDFFKDFYLLCLNNNRAPPVNSY
jgi:hypothetical protein